MRNRLNNLIKTTHPVSYKSVRQKNLFTQAYLMINISYMGVLDFLSTTEYNNNKEDIKFIYIKLNCIEYSKIDTDKLES